MAKEYRRNWNHFEVTLLENQIFPGTLPREDQLLRDPLRLNNETQERALLHALVKSRQYKCWLRRVIRG